jgi:hypothetical protein
VVLAPSSHPTFRGNSKKLRTPYLFETKKMDERTTLVRSIKVVY